MLDIDFNTKTKSCCLSKRSGPYSVHDNNRSCLGSFFHFDKNDFRRKRHPIIGSSLDSSNSRLPRSTIPTFWNKDSENHTFVLLLNFEILL